MKPTKGFVIAGTNSGAGKTTVSLGIMAWLSKQGYEVAPFKVGPDFIDPGHHTRITGTISRNLDGWMLSKEYNLSIFARFSAKADIAIVEGVMGLYDGYDGKSDAGSTAQMAKWLNLPVILVVNAKSMARSAAALVKGFLEFDPDLNFAGIIFNNLGSDTHYQYLSDAMQEYVSVPLLGGIQQNDRIAIPERHLGLVTDDDHMLTQEDIGELANLVGKGLDFGQLGLEKTKTTPKKESKEDNRSMEPTSLRVGVAKDPAFCFYYQDNLDILERNGASLVYFSPMEDQGLPENISGLYFGGGYPELFARRLSENKNMCKAVKQASDQGMPIYGECGGFMYLCDKFFEKNATAFSLTGCFPFTTRLLDRLKALGYREVCLQKDAIMGSNGMRARGHEFHYSEITNPEIIDIEPKVNQVYSIAGRAGGSPQLEGFSKNRTLGSYVHLHFGSNPEFCRHFVQSCRNHMNLLNKNDYETK